MKFTKSQHYIPQFYLRRFSKDGTKLYAFKKGQEKIFQTNKKDLCAKRFLYDTEIPACNPSKKEFVLLNANEDLLFRLEKVFAETLRVIDGLRPSTEGVVEIGDHDRVVLELFVANLAHRHPYVVKQALESVEDVNEYILRTGIIKEDDMEKLRQEGLADKTALLVEEALKRVVAVGFLNEPRSDEEPRFILGGPQLEMVEQLDCCSLLLVKCHQAKEFITASYPLWINWVQDEGESAIKSAYIPLSRNIAALFMAGKRETFIAYADDKHVDTLNQALLSSDNPYWDIAISGSEDMLRDFQTKNYFQFQNL